MVITSRPRILNIEPTSPNSSPSHKRIAVLTSGGDSPGMNAAYRAIVRVALVKNSVPFAVMEGYQGLVEGGDKILQVEWNDVQGILSKGGTIIGTARCKEFRERSGRLKAVKHLAERGINALIVIGGDGSLTGADILRSEWDSLIEENLSNGDITKEQADEAEHLAIVGLVGSIDNDMASTDLTIGAVSSVHRICEAVDSISSTAYSHQRVFVVEVMGRNCGWLALMAAISAGADWLFIPERPPEENWQDVLCSKINQHREVGKRKSIIIVAEGAIDKDLNPIKADAVKEMIVERTGLSCRVTTLGHVQRGGYPAVYDRILATVQGVEAVEAALRATPESTPPLIGVSENMITVQPLMEAVQLTRECGQAIKDKNFEKALSLRDPEFLSMLDSFDSVLGYSTNSEVEMLPVEQRLRIAIVHVGAPAGGMNAATKAAVRFALNRGHRPFLIHNGFAGLISGDVKPVLWMDVESWTVEGGSNLGTNRSQPVDDIGLCAYQLQMYQIQGLIIIGGFEAYTALLQLEEARKTYVSCCIPMILIPATISNNVPGTDYSVGADTALNVIIDACDKIRQSAYSSRKRVFVVEVQGGRCGFLATLAGVAAGATNVYIPEEGLNLKKIANDVEYLINVFDEGENQGRLILRNESVSETYTTEVVANILAEESKGIYDCRSAILGHIQQGGATSPVDRVRATRFAVKCVNFIEQHAFEALDSHQHLRKKSMISQVLNPTHTGRAPVRFDPALDLKPAEFDKDAARTEAISNGVYVKTPESSSVIGFRGTSIVATPASELKEETDFKDRKPAKAWWLSGSSLIRTLARYGYKQ